MSNLEQRFDGKKTARILRERGFDGILLNTPENVYYFTGAQTLPGTGNPILFALRNNAPSFAFVDADASVTLFVWFGVTMGIDFAVSEVRSYMDMTGAMEELNSFLSEKYDRNAKIGIESSCPYNVTELLASHSAKIEVVDALLTELRIVKSDNEISMIEKATSIAEFTLSELRKQIRVGMGRKELAERAREIMCKNGATAIDHLTIAFGASNPEVLIDENLGKGQIVTMDIGAVFEGYVSDIRRLFYSGSIVPQDTEKLYNKMVQIVDQVGTALKPGARFGEIYELASQLYAKNGLEPMFISAGHSMGLVTEEALITQGSDVEIKENMVLNIELYSPDENGTMIGDEETFVIKNGSSVRITTLERTIFVV